MLEVYFYVQAMRLTNQINPSMCSPLKMEERLIEAVREFNCLWEVSSRSFKDVKAKENTWKEVATKVRHKRQFTKN